MYNAYVFICIHAYLYIYMHMLYICIYVYIYIYIHVDAPPPGSMHGTQPHAKQPCSIREFTQGGLVKGGLAIYAFLSYC